MISNLAALRPACQDCQQELDAVLIGIAEPQTEQCVRQHLASCPECAAEARQLQQVLDGLLHAAPPVAMPTTARQHLLASATAVLPTEEHIAPPAFQTPITPARPLWKRSKVAWMATGLGMAAAVAGLLVWSGTPPNLKQADVVINAGAQLVLAHSQAAKYPLVIRSASGKLRGVAVQQDLPPWYTEGVYNDGKAYLLDAANERLVVLNVASGKIERSYPAPGGAAGLAVQGGSVYVKSAASGELRIFKGESCYINKLGKPTTMSQADYMDAVLPLPDSIVVTQHTSGQIFALSPDGETLKATYNVGGAPVGLKSWNDQIVVLDVTGRLLLLGPDGVVKRRLPLSGHPDKLSIMDDQAYLTDRGGAVSVVDLASFKVTRSRKFGKPMDIVALPNGHLALADAQRGLVMLSSDLSEL